MATRMKDIAQDLGVSTMTISKVLRNHPDISEETRKRVLQRIEELNYTPNATARALVTGRTHIIGLIVPDLVHPFFAEVAKGVSSVLRARSYSLVIASSEEDPSLERDEIDHLLSRGVDALIIASVQTESASFHRIDSRSTPFVLIDRAVEGTSANFVGIDDELVGYMATKHLIDVGCHRIAHIGGDRLSNAKARLKGYRRALSENGLKYSDSRVVRRGHTDDRGDVTGFEAMKEILSHRPLPDGVFCYNDTTAMGAMMAILDAGLRIPDDIAIAGCGDVHYANFLRVPLTSVAQESQDLGKNAGKLALSLITAKEPGPLSKILMKPKLVVRESSNRNPA